MKVSKLNEDWQTEKNHRGEPCTYRDLSGEHLGVRLEILDSGATSSEHHYHTSEEEHLIVLEGEGTLILGDEARPIVAGEHVWFPAGEPTPHHIKNTSEQALKFLVFGERLTHDVVVYPEHQVMMIKSEDFRQVTYRDIAKST